MKVEISVPEIVSVFKEIKQQHDRLYELIRTEIREMLVNTCPDLWIQN